MATELAALDEVQPMHPLKHLLEYSILKKSATVLRRAKNVGAMVALSLTLVACASIGPTTVPTTTTTAPTSGLVRSYHEIIDLSGRISVNYQHNDNDEALHGSFTWTQTLDRTNVTLLSPLGQTIAIIDITPNITTMTQAGSPPRVEADADALAEKVLGWPLPVIGLRDWLQGFATDASGRKFIATPQSDHVITADGWGIRYVNWQDDAATQLKYPKRIDLKRHTAQAGEVSIRVIVDSWQAN